MSLLDTLIGSTSQARTQNNADQSQTQVQNKQGQTNTTATTNNNQQQSSSGQSQQASNTSQKNNSSATGTTNSLNQGVVDLVSNLIGSLAGGGGQVSDIVSTLMSKANTPAVSEEDIAGKQSAAKVNFQNNEAVQIGQMQQQIGSTGNTYSQLLSQKGDIDLSAVLSGIVADAKLANAQLSTQQLMDALQGASINGTQIANLVGSIKGANVTTNQNIAGSTSQDTTATSIQQMLELLNGTNEATQSSTSNEDTIAQADQVSSSYTKAHQGSGLLGMLF